jgi:dipeptidyl aminopeptidase/acylaminoacyl peptidase
MKRAVAIAVHTCALALAGAQVPESIVLDGVPPIPDIVRQEAGRYLEFRAAAFQDWHPTRREMLITTRFAESAQVHHLRMPMGARRQLTFLNEPVAGASYQPKSGEFMVFAQDQGGGEFYQYYRFDPNEGRAVLLTDGKSRNTGLRWARSGKQFAYTSTRRNGRDNDIWLMEPSRPGSERLVLEVAGGGWSIADWSRDETLLLLMEYLSINKSHVHLLDLRTGKRRQLTAETAEPVAWGNARFSADGKTIFVTTDQGSEFTRLAQFDLPLEGRMLSAPLRVLTGHVPWNIEEFKLTRDGRQIAAVANENGIGILRLFDADSGKEKPAPELPIGVLSNIRWHENGRDLAFNISSARSPLDVYSLDTVSGKLERWTESETGGVDASQFVEPELITLKSFDGLEISAFVYRPNSRRFPGRRPAIISIHGGPESQSRPGFLARNNFYLNELGIALVVPNVRGSSGYGKTFVMLDNGFRREDSVRDIGAVIDWMRQDASFDPERIAVMGGSYGGYMVLASMAHFGDRLRCGVNVVGISNFLTFLKNTQDYRRDLRRAEYGDERDPEMREFLARISPTAYVEKIRKPLLVMQGKNDPRVPVTEAEQMVEAIRGAGGRVWYLLATDEGHGFAKKKNADFTFYTTIQFFREHLMD